MNQQIIIPVAAFAMVFGIVYIIIISRHREKMNLIEKGIDPNIFKNEDEASKNPLKSGLVLLAIGLGLMVGSWVEKTNILPLDGVGIPSFICLFIGIALIISSRYKVKKS